MELPRGGKRGNKVHKALLVPEPIEHQGGSPALGLAGADLGIPACGNHPEGFGEAGEALDQAVDLARGLELVEAAEGGDDALADGGAVPIGFYNLEVVEGSIFGAAFLSPKEHGGIIGIQRQECQ